MKSRDAGTHNDDITGQIGFEVEKDGHSAVLIQRDLVVGEKMHTVRSPPATSRRSDSFMLPTWPKDGKMDVEQAKRTMSYMTALGELEAKDGFDPATLFTNKLQR